MATDAVPHPSSCNRSWFCQNLSSDHPTYEEFLALERDVSAVLDHSSLSFGRYADELAWEKWSVFAHNRRQEELEKFKTPGLVAQKKAFFDEYYMKLKAMKELHERKQGISIPGSTIPIENGINSAVSDNYLHLPVEKAQNRCSGDNSANLSDGASSSLTVVEWASSPERAAHPLISLAGRSSKSVRQNGRVSSKVRPNIDKVRKHDVLLKGKGTVASVIKTKPGNRTTENVQRKSGNPKPSIHIGSSSKVEKRLPARKGSSQDVAGNINRRVTDARSSVATLHASSPTQLVSSASGVRDDKVKTVGNSSKVEKSLPASTRSTQTAEGNINRRMTETRSSVASLRPSSHTKPVSSPSGVRDIKVKTVKNSSKIDKSLPKSTGSTQIVGSNINKRMTEARPSIVTSRSLARTKLVSSALGARDNNVKTVANSSKVEKSFLASTASTQTVGRNSNKRMTDSRSSVATVHASRHTELASSALSVRDDKGKTASDSHCVRNNMKTSLSAPPKLAPSTVSVRDDKGKMVSNTMGNNLNRSLSNLPKLVSSTSTAKDDKGKRTSDSHFSENNKKTRLPVVSKLASSASSVRDNKGKTASTSQSSDRNSKTRLPVVSRSVQEPLKEVTTTRSSKVMNLNTRSTITRSRELPDKGKSNRSVSVDGHNTNKKETKREGTDNSKAEVRRHQTMLTSSRNASVPKLDHKDKILKRPSADLTLAQRKQRERKPT